MGSGGSKKLAEVEEIAWGLHESGEPIGSIMLADKLIGNRVSFSRRGTNAVTFGKEIAEPAFRALEEKHEKSNWDWYYLGICHGFGRGTKIDHSEAAKAFREATRLGNQYSLLEWAWEEYLTGTSRIETIYRLADVEGILEPLARNGIRALRILEFGPVREIGSINHAFRINEISKLLHLSIYHAAASRTINVEVEKEMRLDVEALKALDHSLANFVLFLIAKQSRANPTGESCEVWLEKAIDRDNKIFYAVMKQHYYLEQYQDLITRVCEEKNWQDWQCYQYIQEEFRHEGDEDWED